MSKAASSKFRGGDSKTTEVSTQDDEFEFVQDWRSTIPAVAWNDHDKISSIKDNVAYILRRYPFFLKPEDFSNDGLYLRPEYGTPSLEWDMVDIIDFTCELQNKFSLDIPDETMYLDFIQLRDVYNFLYAYKKPEDAASASSAAAGARTSVLGAKPLRTNSVALAQAAPSSDRTLIMFPGQGAQKVGMCKVLVEQSPEAKELFSKAKEVLGYDLLDICLNGPEEKLNSTLISQPALFVASMGALARLKKEQPDVCKSCVVTAGLSLGEYTALCFSGVFSFDDGLKLVKARAEAMQEAAELAKTGMVSVVGTGITEAKVAELAATAAKNTNSKCFVSNLLCTGNVVLAGSDEACNEVMRLGESFGATKTIRLAVAGAFHSEYMRPAYGKLKAALDSVKFSPPTIPVVLNVDAMIESEPEQIKFKLLDQLVMPVLWERCMNASLSKFQLTNAFEVGPGNVLTGIMRRILKESEVNPKPRTTAFNGENK